MGVKTRSTHSGFSMHHRNTTTSLQIPGSTISLSIYFFMYWATWHILSPLLISYWLLVCVFLSWFTIFLFWQTLVFLRLRFLIFFLLNQKPFITILAFMAIVLAVSTWTFPGWWWIWNIFIDHTSSTQLLWNLLQFIFQYHLNFSSSASGSLWSSAGITYLSFSVNTSSVFNCLESSMSVSNEFNWVSISSFNYDAFCQVSLAIQTKVWYIYVYIYIKPYIHIYVFQHVTLKIESHWTKMQSYVMVMC